MFAPHEYQLLDFGAGRKLERFGPYVLDRPAPSADNCDKRQPALWSQAIARYEREGDAGRWSCRTPIDQPWRVTHREITLQLKLTDFGHLGIFPEQAANWDWIGQQVRKAGRPMRVLNLFAYTGGSTLAAAAEGAEVVHVDAAENVVAWARRNATASGLAGAPIRWIAEDAVKFVRRELKRGNQYDAVILDPPSYGHGPRGEVWKLQEHLDSLVDMCLELTARSREFILLTCHSQPYAERKSLGAFVAAHPFSKNAQAQVYVSDMLLTTVEGARLPSGGVLRLTANRAAMNPPFAPNPLRNRATSE